LQKDETIQSVDSSKTFAANLEPTVDDKTFFFQRVRYCARLKPIHSTLGLHFKKLEC